ncbi:MAG: creatininase family protein [Thermodesulfobacteria bacterium]|nr:creatininase family protein [Thermodesulfobacteriota bacterium]
MLITDLNMEEFEEGLKKTRTIVLPFGSVEEHGRHLPLGTDTLQMYEIAKLAAQRRPLFVAPPVFYGLCRSTREHPGTVSIRGQTLRALLLDLLESYHRQGLRNFLVLSGHAGGTHIAYLIDAAEEFLERVEGVKIAVASILDLLREGALDLLETPRDSHAGEFETSLMLHFFPDLVKGTSPEEYPAFPKPILVRHKRRFWPGGVWGDPSKASAEKGKMFAERLAKVICGLATKIESMEEI